MKKFFLLSVACLLVAAFASETYAARLGGRATIRPRSSAPRTYTPPARVYRPNPAVRRLNQNQAQGTAPVPIPLFIPPILGMNNLEKLTETSYLVKTGIRRKGDEVSFWMLNNKENKDSKSAKIQYKLNCTTRQFTILAGATYSEPMGKGKEISKGRVNDQPHAIPAGTVIDYLHGKLCKKPATAPAVNPAAASSAK
ncbi:surface-adhesin E family protein [Turicimonas muris]|uniref:surface-adhesin E family protein n=1 Tax=Turicimonas muris TaxID=1796652 RepID=UPI0023F025D4|nr:surface-adhesin E family protein [Turicimonas muris]